MLELIEHDDIVELRMNRPPANALNSALVRELQDALARVTGDGAKGVILSSQVGIFSGGVDVPELLSLDRNGVQEFWGLFMQLNRQLAVSPVPVVAAIAGHCPAGGAVLTLFCDYRIGVEDAYKIGLNEVQVGLPIPPSILLALEEVVGARVARQLAMQGRLVSMEEALDLGLLDELAEPEHLIESALTWLGDLLALPTVAMNETRLLGKARLVAALDHADDATAATDYWFTPETQAAMRRLVASLGKE